MGGERTNEVIAQTIAKCLNNEITNIHVIMLFVTFEAGINPNDIKAMEIFLDMFGGGGVKICLCITHADNHDVKWRQTRVDELHRFESPNASLRLKTWRSCSWAVLAALTTFARRM